MREELFKTNEEREKENDQEEVREASVTFRDYVRALVHDKVAFLSALFLILLAITAIGADVLAPYDPLEQNLRWRLRPPFSSSRDGEGFPHIFGTDELGRDMLSRLMFGARTSVSVGLSGTLISGLVGIIMGLLAGYYRGIFEDIVMRIVDGMLALPSLLIALFILFVLGAGFGNLILIFTLLRWMVYARMTRGLTLGYRDTTFVSAAKAIGCTDRRIMFRHLLPNMFSPLLVLITLEVAFLIIAEASLSFLGFGIQPPNPSWGSMIARGREYIRQAWWLVTLPGLAIFLTTLSLNLVANWFRTITDPAQRWRWLRVSKSVKESKSQLLSNV